MTQRYYVIATLGTSPAVLTELMWGLVQGERAEVVGLEVWTTESGRDRLDGFARGGGWDALLEALAERRDCVPRPTFGSEPDDVEAAIAAGRRTWRVQVFRDEGRPLPDIRTPADAHVIDGTLFERVRHLSGRLPADVALLGSLAGGRKTMSAGLQSAFSLLGRAHDRLVHVLLAPALEEEVVRKHYVVPTAEWAARTGVAVDEQVRLYDVPFPMLRPLLQRSVVAGYASVGDLLDSEDYGQLVRDLRAVAALPEGERRAYLRRRPKHKKWDLVVEAHGREIGRALVNWTLGCAYLAMAAHPEGAEALALNRWLRANGVKIADAADEKEATSLWSKYRRRLEDELRGLNAVGLVDFVPAAWSVADSVGRRHRYGIPAAAAGRVHFEVDDLV